MLKDLLIIKHQKTLGEIVISMLCAKNQTNNPVVGLMQVHLYIDYMDENKVFLKGGVSCRSTFNT